MPGVADIHIRITAHHPPIWDAGRSLASQKLLRDGNIMWVD